MYIFALPEEEEVPFDKSQLVDQIKKGGGAILDDVEEVTCHFQNSQIYQKFITSVITSTYFDMY